jgi:hypothetical protein
LKYLTYFMERELDFAPPGLDFFASGPRLVPYGLVFIPLDFETLRRVRSVGRASARCRQTWWSVSSQGIGGLRSSQARLSGAMEKVVASL